MPLNPASGRERPLVCYLLLTLPDRQHRRLILSTAHMWLIPIECATHRKAAPIQEPAAMAPFQDLEVVLVGPLPFSLVSFFNPLSPRVTAARTAETITFLSQT